MGTSDYSPDPDAFKASSDMTPLEALKTHQHGDLHELIPFRLNAGQTIAALADELGVSTGWVHHWLKRNGYKRRFVFKPSRQQEGGK